MKKLLSVSLIACALFSCRQRQDKNKFELEGNIKNVTDQKIYLEELFFSQKNPETVDSATIKNGIFKLSATAPEEGLYRLRLEKATAGFIFINDQPTLHFSADLKDVSLEGPKFDSKANRLLKGFITRIDEMGRALNASKTRLDSMVKDSAAYLTEMDNRTQLKTAFSNFIIRSVDTLSDPVVALFALGYSAEIDPKLMSNTVPNLAKRFPNNEAVKSVVSQYQQLINQLNQQEAARATPAGIGTMAPPLTMNDTDGNPFSLSQLKGKYVLLDFWASWCGPCRGENPNVVAAFNKFKNKNFTVLGVSLDEDKNAWLEAIKEDQLSWKHVSDLKGWQSAAVGIFGFDAIPYNLLIDPDGKIIAKELRGSDLDLKLSEVLK